MSEVPMNTEFVTLSIYFALYDQKGLLDRI